MNHPKVLSYMHALAIELSREGKYEEAVHMEKQVFDLRVKVLGLDHPYTLNTMGNLALDLSALGRIEEAMTIEKEVLTRTYRVQGKYHPNTLDSMFNLAITYNQWAIILSEKKRHEEAIDFLQESINLHMKVLGEEKTSPYINMKHLSICAEHMALNYYYLGHYEKAIPLFYDVMMMREQIWGPEHPHTKHCQLNINNVMDALDPWRFKTPLRSPLLKAV